MNPKRVDCFKCIHFYVTWDRKFPRGCKAMGFKSKDIPSMVVYQSSGIRCMKFKRKKVRSSSEEIAFNHRPVR